jgi:DNA-binding NarL/FixJ family response regulator
MSARPPDLAHDRDPTTAIRIVVVDDHLIFSHSLVRVLESAPGLTVVGTAGSVSSAVTMVVELRPDVVLMDFELPDGDGPHATAMIKALVPSVHVIMLTARTDDEAIIRAIGAGCSGFVRKANSIDDLLAAIVDVHDGDGVASASDLTPLLRQLAPTGRRLGADLTPRELEVLRLMASGLVNKQVANRLGVRLNTVRNHSQSILGKLRAHSRLEAVATAVRDGIIAYPADTEG